MKTSVCSTISFAGSKLPFVILPTVVGLLTVKRGILSLLLGVTFAAVLGSFTQCAWAGTTTLTFDEFVNGTTLTTQYQNVGVTISGAQVIQTNSTYPPVSYPNVVFPPSGLMTFSFSVGGVKTVSAFVTVYVSLGEPPVSINAYDSSNNLLGSSALSTDGTDAFLSVTTSGNPIAYVNIQGGGGQYTVDNFSFTTSSPTYSCTGFQSPFNVALALTHKTNRAIPLKAQIFDTSNNLVTPATLGTSAPPVVSVSYQSGTSPAVNETSLLDPLGRQVLAISSASMRPPRHGRLIWPQPHSLHREPTRSQCKLAMRPTR
ncbi:hypothetical protein P8935_01615 [Telmatobacter sp. DSM 110680]|uniref:Uncharacterized protein n=1 Tax=Telmatobacter sp. DSM 110680 TaxID=3036704 RepID=A0AAU7DL00_9BACT